LSSRKRFTRKFLKPMLLEKSLDILQLATALVRFEVGNLGFDESQMAQDRRGPSQYS